MGAFSLIVVINLLNRLSNVIPGAQFSRTAIVSNITSRRFTSSLNTSRYILKPKTVSSSNTLVSIRQESSVQTVEKGTVKKALLGDIGCWKYLGVKTRPFTQAPLTVLTTG